MLSSSLSPGLSLGYWVKERALTIAVRQPYRHFLTSLVGHPIRRRLTGMFSHTQDRSASLPSLLISPFQPFRLLPSSRLRSRMVQAAPSAALLTTDWYSSASVSSTWWAGSWEQYVAPRGRELAVDPACSKRDASRQASPAGYRSDKVSWHPKH